VATQKEWRNEVKRAARPAGRDKGSADRFEGAVRADFREWLLGGIPGIRLRH